MSEQNLSLPPELGRLSAFIDSHIECLAGSNSELRSLALCAAKHIFDWALETEESSKPHLKALLTTLTEAAPPQTRSRARNGSATASSVHRRQTKINIQETPLPSLFIEGMNADQVWQQLDLRAARVCENLQALQGENEGEDVNLEGGNSDDSETGDEDEDEAAEMEVDGEDESVWEGLSSEEGDDSSTSTGEGVIDLHEGSSEDGDEDIDGAPISNMDAVRSKQKPKPSRSHSQRFTDLDDGFFDLATFNAETDQVERKELSKRKLDPGADEDSADEELEVDFFGSVDDLGTEGDRDGHELFYNNFFKPPGRTQNKSLGPSKVRFHEQVSVKKIRAVGRGMPVSYMDDESDEEEEEDD